MKYFINRNHLRLVSEVSNSERPSKTELSLTEKNNVKPSFCFNEKADLIFVREADILRNDDFLKLLENFNTRWIFDIRTTPRFDFLAPNRSIAFNIFTSMNINYIDIVGSLGADTHCSRDSKPEEWSKFVISRLNESEVFYGVCLFIFDDEDILRRAERVVPSEIKNSMNILNLKTKIFQRSDESLIAM